MLKLALVKMQISLAMRMDSWAMSLALSLVCFGERAGGGERVRAAGADGGDAVIRLDHVAIAGKQKGIFRVGNDQQGFEMAQRTVGAPFLGKLDGRAGQIAVIFLQLVFEAAEKRERIGRAAREARENFVVVEAASFLRVVLDHALAHGHLAIGGEHHFIVLADAQHRCAAYPLSILLNWHPAIIPRRRKECAGRGAKREMQGCSGMRRKRGRSAESGVRERWRVGGVGSEP